MVWRGGLQENFCYGGWGVGWGLTGGLGIFQKRGLESTTLN